MSKGDMDWSDVEADAARGEDATSEVSPEDAIDGLRGRVFGFLKNEPDVADLEDLGDGIFGFRLAGTHNGVSMTITLTQ